MQMLAKRITLRILLALASLFVLGLVLFALNGLVLADCNSPRMKHLAVDPAATASGANEVTIVAYNIAKGFVHKGGFRFESREKVEAKLKRMAEVIRAEKADYVFLSEAITECGGWELLDHRVIEDDTSDHRPLVCRFRVMW